MLRPGYEACTSCSVRRIILSSGLRLKAFSIARTQLPSAPFLWTTVSFRLKSVADESSQYLSGLGFGSVECLERFWSSDDLCSDDDSFGVSAALMGRVGAGVSNPDQLA